jgi:hypothetical protein
VAHFVRWFRGAVFWPLIQTKIFTDGLSWEEKVSPVGFGRKGSGGLAALAILQRRHILLRARLRVGILGRNGLEVELALALLVEHAIASGAAAAHVHPVGGHHHNRPGPKILRRRRIRAGVPNATDNDILELAAVRVQRIVSAGRDFYVSVYTPPS